MKPGRLYIGLSGYSYRPWQGPGRFYPEGLKAAEFLSYYAGRYATVELDGLWYRLPSEQMVRAWIEHTPPPFLFAPKAHRQITHIHRLKADAHSYVRLMLDRLAPLNEHHRLGPILLQLPPNLRRDDERLAQFLDQLPGTVRWAVEFRDHSWNVPEVETLLRDRGIAWVTADTDERPVERRETAAFRYVRLRRREYGEAALVDWAGWLQEAAVVGKDCFIYFKHEDQGAPWIWADRLAALVKQFST